MKSDPVLEAKVSLMENILIDELGVKIVVEKEISLVTLKSNSK
jgi:hypothetical protein